jgi:DNA-binding MarR family transcriptional regulator
MVAYATVFGVSAGRLGNVIAEPDIWLSESEQAVWRRLLAVECRLRERLDQELRDANGVTLGDYEVLVRLSEAPRRELRMSELASLLLISRSGLTRRVDGLVRDGLVARKACPSDGRGALARLTDAGFEVLRDAAATHVAGVRRYLIGAVRSLEGLSDGLARIERALQDGG